MPTYYEVSTPKNPTLEALRYGQRFTAGVLYLTDEDAIYLPTRDNPVTGEPVKLLDLFRQDLGYRIRPLDAGDTPFPHRAPESGPLPMGGVPLDDESEFA